MTNNTYRARYTPLKSRLMICIQIILQGITPVVLSVTPAITFATARNGDTKLSPQITQHQRAIIEADYIKRNHFLVGHVMLEGETIQQVAKDNFISVSTLRELNQYRFPKDRDFYQIKSGQYLMIPKWESPQQAADEMAKCNYQGKIYGHFLPRHFADQSGYQISTNTYKKDDLATADKRVNKKPAIWNTNESEATAQIDSLTKQAPEQDKQVAQWLQNAGEVAQNGHTTDTIKNMALGSASQAMSSNAENWLNQFGHARIQMNVDDKMHLDGSSADLLLPLHDTQNVLTFTQMGIHDKDDYTTANFGIGQRWFIQAQMWGYNGFIDQELRNNHTRIGVGAEYWRDYFKLAGNAYIGISGWKESKNLEDYEEKAASGFDIRSESYLPAMPQLGAKLNYEQYFGDNVGLFGKDERQNNPFAITAGVNYTPIPLVTAGIDYKQGKDGANDTQFNLQFNYLFGVPWQEQLSPERIDALRTLTGSKLEFVNRNNNMIMQYRKMELIKLSLPALLSGNAQTQQVLLASVKSRHGLSRIQWNDAALIAAGGSIKATNNLQYQITLPSKAGDFPLSAIAYDQRGNPSNTASTLLKVTDNATPPSQPVIISSLSPDVTKANADGVTPVTYTLTTTQQTRLALQNTQGYKVQWKNTGAGTLNANETPLDNQGQATVKVTSIVAGKTNLTATLIDATGKQIDQKQDQQVEFVSQYAMTTVTATPDKQPANGTTPLTWTVTATNNGVPLAGYTVNWRRTSGVGDLVSASSQTNTNGVATITMTSEMPGKTEVAAILLDKNSSEVAQGTGAAEFTGLYALTALTATPTSVTADGTTPITWSVKATNNNAPLANYTVKWSTTGVGSFANDTSTTSSNGIASITMTSSDAGPAHVTATLVGYDGKDAADVSADANFVATVPKVSSITLTTDSTSQWTDRNAQLNAQVTSADGNAIPNIALRWDTSDCNQCSLPVSPSTDAQGKIQNATFGVQAVTNTGEKTVALCTTDATPVCSSPVKVSFFEVPKITGYKTVAGEEKSGDAFNSVRVKGGEFAIKTTVDNALTYAWSSSSASAVPVDNSGNVTLNSDSPATISLQASKTGLSARTISFAVNNSGTWYTLSTFASTYSAINTQLCRSPLSGVDSAAEFQQITTTWGDLSKYAGITNDNGISAWISGSDLGANGASVWWLTGSSTGEQVNEVTTSNSNWAMCK